MDDQYHNLATTHWLKLIESPFQLITTSYVFTEIVTFFNSRYRQAVEVGQRLLTSQRVELIQVDIILFEQAWQLFQQYNDKSYSMTDCVSFVVMQQTRLNYALTFD